MSTFLNCSPPKNANAILSTRSHLKLSKDKVASVCVPGLEFLRAAWIIFFVFFLLFVFCHHVEAKNCECVNHRRNINARLLTERLASVPVARARRVDALGVGGNCVSRSAEVA